MLRRLTLSLAVAAPLLALGALAPAAHAAPVQPGQQVTTSAPTSVEKAQYRRYRRYYRRHYRRRYDRRYDRR